MNNNKEPHDGRTILPEKKTVKNNKKELYTCTEETPKTFTSERILVAECIFPTAGTQYT